MPAPVSRCSELPPTPDPDAELDAILAQVEAASLVGQFTNEEGRRAMRLTAEGVRVARQLAKLGEDGQDALMAALLGEGGDRKRARPRAGPTLERSRATCRASRLWRR